MAPPLVEPVSVDVFLASVSPALVELFDAPRALSDDTVGEAAETDLVRADVDVVDGVLRGSIQGSHLAGAGAWMLVDTRGGPAPDVQIGVGQNWLRIADVDDWKPGRQRIGEGTSVVEGDTVRFSVDLRQSQRWEPAHAGAISVQVATFDQRVSDPGPGGAFGPVLDTRAFLAHLLVEPRALEDPDLTAAVALGFAGLHALVEPDLQPTVRADAAAWLSYGLDVDAWLADQGATWRLRSLPPLGKLLWAWPAGQAATYGAVALGRVEKPLGPEAYRFLVPDVATLGALRDAVVIQPDLAVTADLVDRAIWEQLRYRASDAAMLAWCEGGEVDTYVCRTWATDRREGLTLGTVDGVPVPMSEGTSATLQLQVYRRYRQYIGDCVTATTLTMTTLQAIGVAPLGLGWNGPTLDAPTHDVPLYLEGDHLFAPQSAPGRSRVSEKAWVYVHLPVLQPWRSLSLGWEPNGGIRGGAVAGGAMSWTTLTQELARGLPLATVGEWVRVGTGGGWPGW